jgi:hypothetical protein
MNWVAAELPARFGRGHSRRELFATDGLLTGREARLAGRARRPHAHRGGPDPARPGRAAPGRTEGLEKDYEVEATSSPSGVTHVTFTRAGV